MAILSHLGPILANMVSTAAPIAAPAAAAAASGPGATLADDFLAALQVAGASPPAGTAAANRGAVQLDDTTMAGSASGPADQPQSSVSPRPALRAGTHSPGAITDRARSAFGILGDGADPALSVATIATVAVDETAAPAGQLAPIVAIPPDPIVKATSEQTPTVPSPRTIRSETNAATLAIPEMPAPVAMSAAQPPTAPAPANPAQDGNVAATVPPAQSSALRDPVRLLQPIRQVLPAATADDAASATASHRNRLATPLQRPQLDAGPSQPSEPQAEPISGDIESASPGPASPPSQFEPPSIPIAAETPQAIAPASRPDFPAAQKIVEPAGSLPAGSSPESGSVAGSASGSMPQAAAAAPQPKGAARPMPQDVPGAAPAPVDLMPQISASASRGPIAPLPPPRVDAVTAAPAEIASNQPVGAATRPAPSAPGLTVSNRSPAMSDAAKGGLAAADVPPDATSRAAGPARADKPTQPVDSGDVEQAVDEDPAAVATTPVTPAASPVQIAANPGAEGRPQERPSTAAPPADRSAATAAQPPTSAPVAIDPLPAPARQDETTAAGRTIPSGPAAPAPAPSTFPPSSLPTSQAIPALLAAASGKTPGSVSLELNPGELGRLGIRIERPPGGAVEVHLTAEKPSTLALLAGDEAALHHALDQAGFPASGRSVSFHLAASPAADGASTIFASSAGATHAGPAGASGHVDPGKLQPTAPEASQDRGAGLGSNRDQPAAAGQGNDTGAQDGRRQPGGNRRSAEAWRGAGGEAEASLAQTTPLSRRASAGIDITA